MAVTRTRKGKHELCSRKSTHPLMFPHTGRKSSCVRPSPECSAHLLGPKASRRDCCGLTVALWKTGREQDAEKRDTGGNGLFGKHGPEDDDARERRHVRISWRRAIARVPCPLMARICHACHSRYHRFLHIPQLLYIIHLVSRLCSYTWWPRITLGTPHSNQR